MGWDSRRCGEDGRVRVEFGRGGTERWVLGEGLGPVDAGLFAAVGTGGGVGVGGRRGPCVLGSGGAVRCRHHLGKLTSCRGRRGGGVL